MQDDNNLLNTQSMVEDAVPPDIGWRPADTLMRLSRLGSFHQSRLSFMRILTRRMKRDKWQFSRPEFSIDNHGVGHALYTMQGPERSYTLVAFSHDLPAEQRSDRVIATAWDATFALFDGVPTSEDVERLSDNVPVQEAGRVTQSELTLSRANRSVRLWEHVVSSLSEGGQPDVDLIDEVGYLMRTTAVYGSGKFGAIDRSRIASREELSAPFQAEMLTVYLIRTFVRDLVQHAADCRGGKNSVRLSADIARRLGVGNSTGLGMAPFLINHPNLFNNWIVAREEALKRVRELPHATIDEVDDFTHKLAQVQLSFSRWSSEHPIQAQKISGIKSDIASLFEHVSSHDLSSKYPWNRLFIWSEDQLGLEAQECLVSLMLEPYAALVDGLEECMSSPQVGPARIDGSMSLSELRKLINKNYAWALALDWNKNEHSARAWYVSEEKLEPRLGERFEEPIADYEQPLAPARDVVALYVKINEVPGENLLAEFLLDHPEHRYAARRVQLTSKAVYSEIRDNTIGADLVPFDMLRCKLAFFGATHFDPRSDRWLRICLYGNAPYPEELATGDGDTWVYPPLSDEQ